MNLVAWLGISSFGGLLMLDVSYVGQLMVSRPLICAPVLGFLLGDCRTGMQIGVATEFIWLSIIPIGTSLFPETFIVAFLTTLWTVTAPVPHHALAASLSFAVPIGLLYRYLELQIRTRGHKKFIVSAEENINRENFRQINRLVYLSLGLAFLRTTLFLLTFGFLGYKVISFIPEPMVLKYLPPNRIIYIALFVLGLGVLTNFSLHTVIDKFKKVK